ncbi:hypothetical protein DICA1_D05072 [Diutina catenulata]
MLGLTNTRAVWTRLPTRALRWRHSGSYKASDATVDTDEIITENNPWSPTLYTDIVKVKPRGVWSRAVSLPERYRLSYQTLYEAPGSKYVSLLRRITMSFAVLGVYGAKLFFESAQFDDVYAAITLAATSGPMFFVQYKTRDYVTRIFRLYDKETPQTLESLVTDEKLVMEKLSVMGGKTYNELLQVSNNPSLKLAPPQRMFGPLASWREVDPASGRARNHYVVDNIGGLKMDRLWGIVEHNSGINNGRYIDGEREPEE